MRSIFNIFKKVRIKPLTKDCNGVSLSTLRGILRTQTHSGRCWEKEPTHNLIKGTITMEMKGNEQYVYYLKYGVGYRWDWDDDGCSISQDFMFRIAEGEIIPVTRIHWGYGTGSFIINPLTKEHLAVGGELKELTVLQDLMKQMVEIKAKKELKE